jgi:hypothetical protein
MKVICPKCNSTILSENVNATSDVAHCKKCGDIFKLSDLLAAGLPDNFDVNSPPKGAWFFSEFDKIIIGATTRSPVALFIVPFMIIWTSGAIGGIYGTQLVSGKFSLLQTIFGIPFVIGAIVFGSFAIMTVAGKVEITLIHDMGKIFIGVGNIGWTRKFDWREVRIIREEKNLFNYPGSSSGGIILEGKTRIKFGSNLSEKRRYFIISALKKQKWYHI